MRTGAIVLAFLLSGCASPAIGPTGIDRALCDSISDAELKRTGQWQPGDAEARAILLRSRRARPHMLPRLTLRRAAGTRKLLDPVEVVPGLIVPVPDVGALLGFDYQEWAWVLPSQNAILILHPDQPPTILPIDPEQPIPTEETPEPVYQRVRAQIGADLRGLPQPGPRTTAAAP